MGFAMPDGLPAKMHGVVPMHAIIIDGLFPLEINLVHLGAESPEDFKCCKRVAADVFINLDIAQVHRIGDFHALDAFGLERKPDAGAD